MMSDTFFFLSSTMSNEYDRIRQIKQHINQLLSELRLIQPKNKSLENFPPFNITMNSTLITSSHENCPYLSHEHAILHSTTKNEYKKLHQRDKLIKSSPKKTFFAASVCATSTPKKSSNENLLLKPHLTSTPRRNKRPSTTMIPLKRLLYNKNDPYRQRHSTKRFTSLNRQWI